MGFKNPRDTVKLREHLKDANVYVDKYKDLQNIYYMEKVCSKCLTAKPFSEYNNDKSKHDGKYPSCKQCKKSVDKQYRLNNMEKVKVRDKEYYLNNSEKKKDIAQKWYMNNHDKARHSQQLYYVKNYAKIKETQASWNDRNKDKLMDYHKNYHKNRSLQDIHFRIKRNLRSRFKACVVGSGNCMMPLLSCSLDFFKSWIEFQFSKDSNLSWENYGTYWHYDHVVPCASYDLSKEEDIAECFHWSNFQPLNKQKNLQKGSKLLPEIIDNHKQIVSEFCQLYDVPNA